MGAAAPILIVIPLSWLVVGWAMNRMTRRLDGLARDLSARGAAATEPIRLDNIPVEVAPLLESMNGLILRLQAALATQKRFLADAAHELRSPLAAMQIQLDNVASGDAAARQTGLAALSSGVRRAGALVARLLDLARLDETPSAAFEPADISALLLDCVASLAPLAGQRSIDLGAQVEATAPVRAAPTEMRTLFDSLLDNAHRYTPEGGKIDVTLAADATRLVVEITDTGPGIPEGVPAPISAPPRKAPGPYLWGYLPRSCRTRRWRRGAPIAVGALCA
ncbi:MAG: hypothetical protein B7Z80_01710 [Rhodospirillales bacterium 20-64-7]|nr:MAG: hypothetical protein B7Z80_01710 [Rhodospirillales bacterium 20-64-7]